MTDQHRATPDQWARCTSDAKTWSGAFNCILELRSRIEALELAFRAQTGSLTPAERVELGVVPVSDVKAAVELSVNHAVHDSRCLSSAFDALCAYARSLADEYDGDMVKINKQIEVVKAVLIRKPMLTPLGDRLPGPDDVAPYLADLEAVMVVSGVDTDPWCWVARWTSDSGWLFRPATIQWITVNKITEFSRTAYTHWAPAAALPLPTCCSEVSDAD